MTDDMTDDMTVLIERYEAARTAQAGCPTTSSSYPAIGTEYRLVHDILKTRLKNRGTYHDQDGQRYVYSADDDSILVFPIFARKRKLRPLRPLRSFNRHPKKFRM